MSPDWRFLVAIGLVAASAFPAPADVPTGDNQPSTDVYGDVLPEGAIARFGSSRLKHSASIHCLAYSPDDKVLATSGQDGATRLWDATTGKLLGRHDGYASAISFSPDSKLLAVLSRDQVVLLETDHALPRRVLNAALDNPFHSLAFTADGSSLVTASSAREGMLLTHWDARTGAIRAKTSMPLVPGPGVVAPATDAADKAVLYTCDRNVVTCWSGATGKPLQKFAGSHKVHQIALSRRGTALAALECDEWNSDPTIRIWDPATGKQLQKLPAKSRGTLVFSADGRRLACIPSRGDLPVWEVATGNLVQVIQVAYDRAESGGFTHDGKVLATCESRGVRIWDTATGKEIVKWTGHIGAVSSIAFAPDGKTLASGGEEGAVYLWPQGDGTRPRLLTANLGSVYNVVYAPGKPLLAASGTSGVSLWDSATGKLVRKREEIIRTGNVAFFPDGKTLLVGDDWRFMWLWSTETDSELRYNSHGYTFSSFERPHKAALSPDGSSLVEMTHRGPVWLRNPATGEKRFQIKVDNGNPDVGVAVFTPDSRSVALLQGPWSRETRVVMVDAATSAIMRSNVKLGWHRPTCAAFSPAGQLLAVGNSNGSVTLLETSTATVVLHFASQRGPVYSIAFSPDGTRLATAGADCTILLWDLDRLLLPQGPVAVASKDLSRLWFDLASEDAKIAYQAGVQFRRDPDKSAAFVLQKLQALWKHDPEQIRQLIANLESPRYAVREGAMAELVGLEDLAAPALHEAQCNKPNLEVCKRLEILVRKLNPCTPSQRQLLVLRAMAIMECGGNKEGQAWLEQLANGPPDTWLAREARLTLDRLLKRRGL